VNGDKDQIPTPSSTDVVWWFPEIPIIALVLFLDRFSKHLAVTYLVSGESVQFIPGLLKLLYSTNTGAAFSILSNQRIVLSLFSIIVIGLMVYWRNYLTMGLPFLRLVWSLVLAGALGNLWDRILRGYVVDFLAFDFIVFPVFNMADIAISCGGLLYLLFLLSTEFKQGKR